MWCSLVQVADAGAMEASATELTIGFAAVATSVLGAIAGLGGGVVLLVVPASSSQCA